MEIICECECEYQGQCQYFDDLENAINSLEEEYPSITLFEYVKIDPSEECFWDADISEDEYAFLISCGLLESSSFSHLKWVLTRVYFEAGLDNYDDDIEDGCSGDCQDEDVPCDECGCSDCCKVCDYASDSEEGEWDETDNLTRAMRQLGQNGKHIQYPIEIIQSDEINALADSESRKIKITSAAVNSLSEEEVAFILSHEEAHLDRKHAEAQKEVSSLIGKQIKEVFNDEKTGFFKKVIEAVAVTTVGVAAGVATSKLLELDADGEAQKRMKEAGYSHDDTLKFAKRREYQPGKLISSHPSWKNRKKMLE